MQLGQVVDFCIAYNDRQKRAEKEEEKEARTGKRIKAGQREINAFFG